jgi:hypothetical protein
MSPAPVPDLSGFPCLACAGPLDPSGRCPACSPDCPRCGEPTDAKQRCWSCGYRRCACGRDTGSVLIATCVCCGVKEVTGE